MHLMQFADSALPVGGFSFSCTLESAVESGIVHDQHSLQEYITVATEQAATSDCVVALETYRASLRFEQERIIYIDNEAFRRKISAEQRTMCQRMGRKLCELSADVIDDERPKVLLRAIRSASAQGMLPSVQGVVAAAVGADERELYAMSQYGLVAMMAGAALRCMRITHRQTQQILYAVGDRIDELYAQSRTMSIEQTYTFSPQMDLMAALHEKAQKRLFMN